MKININVYGEKTTVKTAVKSEGVHVLACELDNTIAILFDGVNPVCMADETALNELEDMYLYDKTDKILKGYIDVLSEYLK